MKIKTMEYDKKRRPKKRKAGKSSDQSTVQAGPAATEVVSSLLFNSDKF